MKKKNPPSVKKLEPKQLRFIAEYLKDQNGTQAAIRAGYSKKTARVQAAQLLSKLSIREAVLEGIGKIKDEAIVNKAYVLTRLVEMVERCMQHKPVRQFDYYKKEMVQERVLDPETGHMVGLWEFDSAGANKALHSIAEIIAIIKDHKVVSGPGGRPLIPEKKEPEVNLDRFSDAALDAWGVVLDKIIKNARPAGQEHANGHGNGNGATEQL